MAQNPQPLEEPAENTPLPTAPEALLARLDALGIAYHLYHHDAVFTVAESLRIERDMKGRHCRNLFVRDKRETMFLISAANETAIDLKAVENALDCKRLSFGSAARLWTYLGVRPGSVCPYAIVNDTGLKVQPVLDADFMKDDLVNFHPLVNTMTIGTSPQDLLRFIRSTGHEPIVMDFTTLTRVDF